MRMRSTVALGCQDQRWTLRSPAMVTSRCMRAEAMREIGARNQFQSQMAIRMATARAITAITPPVQYMAFLLGFFGVTRRAVQSRARCSGRRGPGPGARPGDGAMGWIPGWLIAHQRASVCLGSRLVRDALARE